MFIHTGCIILGSSAILKLNLKQRFARCCFETHRPLFLSTSTNLHFISAKRVSWQPQNPHWEVFLKLWAGLVDGATVIEEGPGSHTATSLVHLCPAQSFWAPASSTKGRARSEHDGSGTPCVPVWTLRHICPGTWVTSSISVPPWALVETSDEPRMRCTGMKDTFTPHSHSVCPQSPCITEQVQSRVQVWEACPMAAQLLRHPTCVPLSREVFSLRYEALTPDRHSPLEVSITHSIYVYSVQCPTECRYLSYRNY